MLTSPRVVIDADGEYLYIPADRSLEARAVREKAAAAAALVDAALIDPALVDPALVDSALVDAAASGAGVPVGAVLIDAPGDGAPVGEDESPAHQDPTRRDPDRPTVREDVVAPVTALIEDVVPEPVTAEVPTQAPAIATAEAPPVLGRASSVLAELDEAQLVEPAPETPVLLAQDPNPSPPRSQPSPTQTQTRPQTQADLAPARRDTRPAAPLVERPYDLELARAGARVAARRRAVIMVLLFIATAASWAMVSASSVPTWIAVPASVLLVLHVLASRVAGLRSRETLTLLSAQLHAAELLLARPQRQVATAVRTAEVVAEIQQAPVPDRVARRAAAVGAETWEPVPVPPPTYTLKPAVHRGEPAPLDLPAAQTDVPAAAAVSRGALPRRAADVERILALESHLDELFEDRKAVNG